MSVPGLGFVHVWPWTHVSNPGPWHLCLGLKSQGQNLAYATEISAQYLVYLIRLNLYKKWSTEQATNVMPLIALSGLMMIKGSKYLHGMKDLSTMKNQLNFF